MHNKQIETAGSFYLAIQHPGHIEYPIIQNILQFENGFLFAYGFDDKF